MTEESSKVSPKKKGGARPGAGRKPLVGAKPTTVILTEDLLIQLKRLGGSSWIRSQIAASKSETPAKMLDEVLQSFNAPKDSIYVQKAPDNAMNRAGLAEGTLLFLQKDLTPAPGNIVLIESGGLKTLRRMTPSETGFRLIPESTEPNHTEYVLPRGAVLDHLGVVVFYLAKP